MDLPTDVEELVTLLVSEGWQEQVQARPVGFPVRLLRRSDGFLFEARRERKVWRGRLDRGDGWRLLEHVKNPVGIGPSDAFDLSALPGARSAALAYQSAPQHPYCRWQTLVPRCIEWLSVAPPAPTLAFSDVFASLSRRDFHQACLDIIDRRTHGLHLRPMPPAPDSARTLPVELLRWIRRSEVHGHIRWPRDHLLGESSGFDRPSSIGGESQMLWVAYLDEPEDSPDPAVVIHSHRHSDFVRGETLASLPLSRYLFECLVAHSDFHSSWTRPVNATGTESILWSEETPWFPMRVGATWIQLGGSFLVDDPAQAVEELSDAAQLHNLFEWGTRTLEA